MSTLKIAAIENANGAQGYLPAPDGLIVNAYLASEFNGAPTAASFNPHMTPAATATTASDGTASLTGLSSAAYAVCVIDAGGEPHFAVFPAGYVGDGITHAIRYIPAPTAAGIDEITTLTDALAVTNAEGPITAMQVAVLQFDPTAATHPSSGVAQHNTHTGKPLFVNGIFDFTAVGAGAGFFTCQANMYLSDDATHWRAVAVFQTDYANANTDDLSVTLSIVVPPQVYWKWDNGGLTASSFSAWIWS